MREIRFRAWHKVWKRMYDIDCTHYIDAPEYGEPIAWDDNGFNFMQFTGLEDKNGKEVFESDILRNGRGRICLVEWFSSPTYVGWDLKALNTEGGISHSPFDMRMWEVIGNIYEHSHLLK